MSAVHLGRKKSPETRAKIAAAKLGTKHSPETMAKLRGREFSPEHRANISKAAKSRRRSGLRLVLNGGDLNLEQSLNHLDGHLAQT